MLVLAAFAIMDWNVVCVVLAWFVYISCKQQLILLETGGEDVPFGYDFSQGYASLEGETPPPTRRRRPNMFHRWLQRRAARKAQREVEIGRATSELQSPMYLVCRLLLEKKKI